VGPAADLGVARVCGCTSARSVALRTRRHDDATVHVARANEALAALAGDYDAARIESALIEAYIASRRDASAVTGLLDRAEALVERAAITAPDRACFRARLVDHRAYQLNHAGEHVAALALYETLPATDAHPFASYRRDAGLAFGYSRAGRTAEALALAHRACDHAGDGGYTRLRAMGLILVAAIGGPPAALDRARAIAVRLGVTAPRTRRPRTR
jgi:hypothetical protein